MVTCPETHIWISQPSWHLFYKYKKVLSQKQKLCVDKSSQTIIFTTDSVCSNLLYCEHGVSFFLSPSWIHVLMHPWIAMLLLRIRDDVTIVAIDFEWMNVTQTKQRRDMRLTSWPTSLFKPSLYDFPLWIRLDLDPDLAQSRVKSQCKTDSGYGPWSH